LLDYKNLIYFTTTKELNRRQVRWAETLASYNFKIHYVKGTENARADVLSKKLEYVSNKTLLTRAILKTDGSSLVYNRTQLAAISRLKNKTFEELIRKGYNQDPVVKEQEKTLGVGFSKNNSGLLLF
jgi:hypothetical protein